MAKAAKKWSSAQITLFLEFYEQHPCLWNPKNPLYKERVHRDEAIEQIVEAMSHSVTDFDAYIAKAKIRSIRNAYILERHKVLKSQRSATSTDDIYTPTLTWFPVADRFLKNIVETRDAKTIPKLQKLKEETEEIHATEVVETSLRNDSPAEEAAVVESCSVQSPAPLTSHQSREGPYIFAAKRKTISNPEEPAHNKIKLSNNVNSVARVTNGLQEVTASADTPQPITDEFDAFGKMVAAHLRLLPTHTALECQSDMFHYLIQKRLGRRGSLSTIAHSDL